MNEKRKGLGAAILLVFSIAEKGGEKGRETWK